MWSQSVVLIVAYGMVVWLDSSSVTAGGSVVEEDDPRELPWLLAPIPGDGNCRGIRARPRNHPRREHHDLYCGSHTLHAWIWTGERFCGDASHRHRDIRVHGICRHTLVHGDVAEDLQAAAPGDLRR